MKYRIVWDYDDDPDMSYLPATEQEYDEQGPFMSDTCRICFEAITRRETAPGRLGTAFVVHTRTGRIACRNGHGHGFATSTPLTWEEYRETYGNLDRYVHLHCNVQHICGSCGAWETVASLYGIDLYMPDRYHIGTRQQGDDSGELNTYQIEIEAELIQEAKTA